MSLIKSVRLIFFISASSEHCRAVVDDTCNLSDNRSKDEDEDEDEDEYEEIGSDSVI